MADYPGRGEPGTGTLDLDRYLNIIQASGYSGFVSLEYIPTTTTIDSLRWLRQQRVIRP
jgi:hydroxypyruvate isomerase